ncbi:MAG: type II toxin-antitoxin system death-on-curing family toxin [Elusimicrobia bacterium]|nr:type II toxin-antitoxin system death-on-curing family toxin [Elusimicrobiota bacterium]
MKEPLFLTLAEILEIHKDEVERYGGDHGIRDLGLVESAIAMPQATFGGEFLHKTIFEMAAAYAYHISENQPFVDGNKRTALGAAFIFLRTNGIVMNDPEGVLYGAMIKVGTRQWGKRELLEQFRKLSRRRRP